MSKAKTIPTRAQPKRAAPKDLCGINRNLDMSSRIDSTFPGFRVIAGPYSIDNRTLETKRLERRACLAALNEQKRLDPSAKLITCRGMAYVLRSTNGWMEGGGDKGFAAQNGISVRNQRNDWID